MVKKKLIGAMLCLALLLSVSGPAWAAEANLIMPAASNITGEQAITSLVKLFPELTRGKTFKSTLEPDRGAGEAVWVIVWAPDNLPIEMNGYLGNLPGITAEVKASNGEVLSMSYRPDPKAMVNKSVALTKEQAYQLAQKVLKQLHNDKMEQLRYLDNRDIYQYYYGRTLDTSYSFTWERVMDGNPINGDQINISIDARNGALTQYRYSWHTKQLPAFGSVMPANELTSKVLSEVGMYLTYIDNPQNRLQTNVQELIPVYSINAGYAYLDAYSGKWLNYDGSEVKGKVGMVTGDFKYTPKAETIAENPPRQEYVKPEAALKTAEDFLRYLGVEGKVRRSGGASSYGPGSYHRTTWSYSVDNNMRYGQQTVDVEIDANTGKVAGFNRYDSANSGSGSGVKLGDEMAVYDEALKSAHAMIAKINPELKDLVILQNSPTYNDKEPNYYFSFIRLLNGIPYSGASINVGISKETGVVTNYNVYWPPVRVKADSINLSLEQAVEKFKSNPPWKLSYIFPRNEQGEEMGTGVAVYLIRDKASVDAVSGEMVGYSWNNEFNNQPLVKEFSGFAAPALSLLKQNGLLPEGNTNAQAAVTRRQALKAIVAATGSNMGYSDDQSFKLQLTDIGTEDPDGRIFITAIRQGIIPNQGQFAPEQALTREELAVWLVKGLGYQQIAQINNQIVTPYKDMGKILPAKRNYVAIAHGLRLLTGDGGYFNPQQPVTWEELAVAATRTASEAQIVNQRLRR